MAGLTTSWSSCRSTTSRRSSAWIAPPRRTRWPRGSAPPRPPAAGSISASCCRCSRRSSW